MTNGLTLKHSFHRLYLKLPHTKNAHDSQFYQIKLCNSRNRQILLNFSKAIWTTLAETLEILFYQNTSAKQISLATADWNLDSLAINQSINQSIIKHLVKHQGQNWILGAGDHYIGGQVSVTVLKRKVFNLEQNNFLLTIVFKEEGKEFQMVGAATWKEWSVRWRFVRGIVISDWSEVHSKRGGICMVSLVQKDMVVAAAWGNYEWLQNEWMNEWMNETCYSAPKS